MDGFHGERDTVVARIRRSRGRSGREGATIHHGTGVTVPR